MDPKPSAAAAARCRFVVTGAGSGIGLAVVEQLAAAGHPVLAGARRAGDLTHLATLPGVVPQRLDVCQADGALAALGADAAIEGLVHCAGIGGLGHLAAWGDDDVLRLFETNVFGLMRLTRQLLPALLRARGRIVIIGSMGGSITMPLYGPYTMSKFALEAYADCLRQELAPHGVAVSIVQPGAVSTRIGASAQPGNEARLASTPPPFGAEADAALQALRRPPSPPRPDEPESATHRRAAPPSAVAEVVMQVLFDPAPALRYLVGTRWEGERVLKALAERLVDAARSPGQRLGRDEIVALIDRELSARLARQPAAPVGGQAVPLRPRGAVNPEADGR